jgi:hypothetical protein
MKLPDSSGARNATQTAEKKSGLAHGTRLPGAWLGLTPRQHAQLTVQAQRLKQVLASKLQWISGKAVASVKPLDAYESGLSKHARESGRAHQHEM